MKYDYSFNGIDLVQTCGACPESYNAFSDGTSIGYLRLRHGNFTVDYEVGGNDPKRIWTVKVEGDGIFSLDEREDCLQPACHLLSVCHQ